MNKKRIAIISSMTMVIGMTLWIGTTNSVRADDKMVNEAFKGQIHTGDFAKLTSGMTNISTVKKDGLVEVKHQGHWGLVTVTGAQVLAPVYNNITEINSDRLLLEQNKKFGISDMQGHILAAPTYKGIQWDPDNSNSFLVTADNKKYGYIDNNGKALFSETFDGAWSFVNGRAMVRIDKKYGYIDMTGKEVIPAKYDDATPSLGEAVLVKEGKQILALDPDGNELAKVPGSDVYTAYREGYGIVKNGGKYSYVDTTGHVLTTISAEEVFPFVNGSALIARKASHFNWGGLLGTVLTLGMGGYYCPYDDGGLFSEDYKFGYINKQGMEYIPTKNDFNGIFYKNRVITKIKGKYGCLDRAGNIVVPTEFNDISDFCGLNDDIVVVKVGDYYSYYKVGAGLFSGKYIQAQKFTEGLAAVAVAEDKWGYIDEAGQQVIKARFEDATSFDHGVAVVKTAGKKGVIDKTGQYVIKPSEEYQALKISHDGSIIFKKSGKWGLMDQHGNVLIVPQYDEIV
jgi:hypothetical protein